MGDYEIVSRADIKGKTANNLVEQYEKEGYRIVGIICVKKDDVTDAMVTWRDSYPLNARANLLMAEIDETLKALHEEDEQAQQSPN